MATFKGAVSIRQGTAANQQFDGTAPSGARTVSGNLITYPEEAASDGGLFNPSLIFASDTLLDRMGGEFALAELDLVVVEYALRLGAATTDPNGKEVLIRKQSTAGETDYYRAGEDLILPAGHTIEVVTTGSAAVQTASITVVPYLFLHQLGR